LPAITVIFLDDGQNHHFRKETVGTE
jgi:hypothetical protein